MKFLLLLGLIVLAYCVFKVYKKKIREGAHPLHERGEDMVRCAHCGLHLPRSESLVSGEAFYCSAEHRRLRETAR